MPRADRHARDLDPAAGGERPVGTNALVVDSDLGCDLPVTEAELTAIERLLGDDLARLLRGSDRN